MWHSTSYLKSLIIICKINTHFFVPYLTNSFSHYWMFSFYSFRFYIQVCEIFAIFFLIWCKTRVKILFLVIFSWWTDPFINTHTQHFSVALVTNFCYFTSYCYSHFRYVTVVVCIIDLFPFLYIKSIISLNILIKSIFGYGFMT